MAEKLCVSFIPHFMKITEQVQAQELLTVCPIKSFNVSVLIRMARLDVVFAEVTRRLLLKRVMWFRFFRILYGIRSFYRNDREHWKRTIQAMLALYSSKEDVFVVAQNREMDRNNVAAGPHYFRNGYM